MTAPIGLQLYSLRDALADDYAGTMKKVADMGFIGVEPAGFPGSTLLDAKKIYDDLGLSVFGAHVPLPLGEQKAQVLETIQVLGCQHIISPFMPRERYQSVDDIKAVADEFNQANAVARENGLTFSIHNHDWEYFTVEGKPAYKYLLEFVEESVCFELDTYWIKTAGQDPVAVITEMGKRAPLIHIKDGPAERGKSMQALGEGIIDIPAIVKAAESTSEWIIVELDHCDTDMVEAVQKSYSYLTEKGLARGNK